MEFGRDEFECDQLHLPVDAEVQAVMREGDRVAAEVLHSPLPSERSPLLTKSQSASSTEDSDASDTPPPSPQSRDDASTNEIIRHESYYLVKLFVPMLLTQFAQVVADSTLSMLIGHTTIGADTKMLAALTLTSMYPALLVTTIYMGIISAVDTLCAQAFGGKRLAELWLFIQAGILLCTAIMPLLVGLTLSAAPVLDAMGQDPVIIEMSKPVLIVSAFTLVPMIAYTFGTSALRAQNIAIPCTIATIAGWVISTPMAWYLAFYTPLGYVGIAMQTTISSTVQAVIVLYAVMASEGFAHWPGWQLQAATRLALKMAKLSGSGMLMVGCSSGAIMIFSIIGGMLPDAATVVTASGIFLSMLMYMLVTENSISGASAVRIGNALGRGQAKQAKVIMLMSTAANALVGLVEMLVAIVIAESFANIFTTDADAARVAAQMIRQLSPMFLITGFYASAQAALMACGKQFACAVMGFVTIAVVGLPIGLWFAISLDGGIVGLWYGSVIGFLLCVLAEFAWIWRLDWDAVALDAKHKTHIELSESSSAQSVPAAA